jgi:SAM-dependent methyltransferase
MDSNEVAARFAANLVTYGPDDPRTLEWSGRDAQRRRFEVLAEVGELDGADVLDMGCGLGDFWGWLSENTTVDSYVGVDASPALVDAAFSRWDDEADFRVGDAANLEEVIGPAVFDFVFASGLLYLHDKAWATTVVADLFARARQGMALNVLRAPTTAGRTGFAITELVDMAEYAGARWVLRNDYVRHDMTMYLYPASSERWGKAAWSAARYGS